MARAAKGKDVDALEQANEADTMVIRDELAAQEGLIKSKDNPDSLDSLLHDKDSYKSFAADTKRSEEKTARRFAGYC